MENCVFCKVINGDLPSYVVKETEDIIVYISLEGHPLIAPKKHLVDIFDLDDNTAAQIMQEAIAISKALKEATGCEGINLVQSNGSAAGQDVFHFHLHIKPRWANDDVTLSWNIGTKSNSERASLRDKVISALS